MQWFAIIAVAVAMNEVMQSINSNAVVMPSTCDVIDCCSKTYISPGICSGKVTEGGH
jgi:hypothetical protein